MKSLIGDAQYWMLVRQITFLKAWLFSLASAALIDNASCGRLRAVMLRLCGARIGPRCVIRGGLRLPEGFNFCLGADVYIGAGCTLDTSAPITVGARVSCGYGVAIMTGNHAIGPSTARSGATRPAPVTIGEGAWIGAHALIYPGVTIGPGAVIAAGAIVTSSVAPNTVVAPPASTRTALPAALR